MSGRGLGPSTVGLPNGQGCVHTVGRGQQPRASHGAFLLDTPVSICFSRATRGQDTRESIPLGPSVAICHMPPTWKAARPILGFGE